MSGDAGVLKADSSAGANELPGLTNSWDQLDPSDLGTAADKGSLEPHPDDALLLAFALGANVEYPGRVAQLAADHAELRLLLTRLVGRPASGAPDPDLI